MVKTVILFVCLLLVISCAENPQEEQKPIDLLSKEKMARVLTDISLMEAAANIQPQQKQYTVADTVLKFNIYKQHSITREQYEASLNYYSAHTNEFKEIYATVLEILNKQKGN